MHEAGSHLPKLITRKGHFTKTGLFVNIRLDASTNDLSETP